MQGSSDRKGEAARAYRATADLSERGAEAEFSTAHETEPVWMRPGHEAHVRVRVSESTGRAGVDVREFLTPEAYPLNDATMGQRNTARIARGRKPRPTRDDGYVGPSRHGLYLTQAQAFELAERIVAAAMACPEADDIAEGVAS